MMSPLLRTYSTVVVVVDHVVDHVRVYFGIIFSVRIC